MNESRPCVPRVVVAIPAHDEQDHIISCLQALAAQENMNGEPLLPNSFVVLLFANNCIDKTIELARSIAAVCPYELDVKDVTLPKKDASAGEARSLAMAEAARILAEDGSEGILMTTDADTRVPPRWIAEAIASIETGADAATGALVLDAEDEAKLPHALKARGVLEDRYGSLLCEIEARLNPEDHDPWPRHAAEPGASLAVSLSAFLAVGGIPKRKLGEDKAFCDVLRANGYRIRHTIGMTVITSGRLTGRASGGCADTMRRRIEEPDARCDDRLESIWLAIRRYRSARRGHVTAPAANSGLRPSQLRFHIMVAAGVLWGLRIASAVNVMPQRRRRVLTPVSLIPMHDEAN